MTSGDLKVEGRREAFAEFVGMLDTLPVLVQHRHAVAVCHALKSLLQNCGSGASPCFGSGGVCRRLHVASMGSLG